MWRQGHLLTAEAAVALGFRHVVNPEQTMVVVVSHDCDLAQESEFEPVVEVIVGQVIEKLDGNCTHAKTPRKLHIEFDGDLPCFAEFEATAKLSVKKEELTDFIPRIDLRLSPENHSTLQFWLASRYRRSAFPDEFERRLKDETKLAKKISKALEVHGSHISGIFFDVDEGMDATRNGPGDTYMLDIYILHLAEPDFIASEAAAQKAASVIESAFRDKLYKPTNTWQHIELRACEVVSESVLTYQHFKQLKRWRMEHISLGSDPQQAVLVE